MFSNPDWETEFNRFEQAISSSPSDPCEIRHQAIGISESTPGEYSLPSHPILAGLLRVSDDPNRSVQAAAAHCLKRIACLGGEESGFAVAMGRCGVIASLLGLLLEPNDNNSSIALRTVWVKCLWSLVTFGSSIRIGLARLGGFRDCDTRVEYLGR
ncbi:ARM repeat superfamily protein [Raphanus sativus]|nr:ARM repeat superfamily protein [Raphanus sativus]